MKKDELFLLGKIVRAFGSKGGVMVQSDREIPATLKNTEPVFISIDENLVPFFISDFALRPKNQAVVQFIDIESMSDAAILMNREVYIQRSSLPKTRQNKLYREDIAGYTVIDKTAGNIGSVRQVLDHTHQSLLVIDFNGKEILVPVVDEIVTGIDTKTKTITISAPEGLLDIYL